MFKRIRKYFVMSLLSISYLGWGGRIFINKKENKLIKPWIENNLNRVIKSQNEKLHIQYPGIPKINCEKNNIDENKAGMYDPRKETIYIRPSYLITTPNNNFMGILAKILTFGKAQNVKSVLDHELGHYYVDKLGENLGIEDWPEYDNLTPEGKIITLNDLAKKMISEGIAEYFSQVMNDEEDFFKDTDWPKKEKNFFSTNMVYRGGAHLVKPIIDEYGKKGIEYLIISPPTERDLKNIPRYQKRTLEQLSQQQI